MCKKCGHSSCGCQQKVVSIQGLPGKTGTGKTGAPGVPGAAGNPGADSSSRVQNTIFIDTEYGSDDDGIYEDSANPFQTIAAAIAYVSVNVTRSASLPRVRFVLAKGIYEDEPITLLDYCDWDLNGSTIKITDDTLPYAIGDNGIGVHSKILGRGIIDITTVASNQNTYGLSIGGASVIEADLDVIEVNTSGNYVIRGIRIFGAALCHINVNSVSVIENESGTIGNGAGITAESGATVYLNFNTVYVSLTGGLNGIAISSVGTTMYVNGKLLTVTGGNSATGMFAISSQGSGSDGPVMNMSCEEVVFDSPGASASQVSALAAGRGAKLNFDGKIISCTNLNAASDCAGIAIWEKGASSNTSIRARFHQLNFAATGVNQYGVRIDLGLPATDVIDIQGRVKCTGTDCSAIYAEGGKVLVQNSVLLPAGAGYSARNSGGTIINLGNTRSTTAVNGVITNMKTYSVDVSDAQDASVMVDVYDQILVNASVV